MKSVPNILVSKVLIADNNLSSNEKILVGLIFQLQNSQGCFATNPYFAKILNLSSNRISAMLTQLEKKGYLHRDKARNVANRQISLKQELFMKIEQSYSNKARFAQLKNEQVGTQKWVAPLLKNEYHNKEYKNKINNIKNESFENGFKRISTKDTNRFAIDEEADYSKGL